MIIIIILMIILILILLKHINVKILIFEQLHILLLKNLIYILKYKSKWNHRDYISRQLNSEEDDKNKSGTNYLDLVE